MKSINALTLFLLLLFLVFIDSVTTAQDIKSYHVLKYNTGSGAIKNKEITNLFSGERRQIVQLALGNNQELGFHSVEVPITIFCVTGKGELIVNGESESEKIKLEPGSYITIEPDVLHNVIADPAINILLVKFTALANHN